MSSIVTRPAVDADWAAIEALLTDNSLPLAGARAHAKAFLIAIDETGIVGCAGIEAYGSVALLRSVAVQSTRRTTGIGGSLLEAVTAAAASGGIETLYLLTTTAASYFERRGYAVVERAEVPVALRSSAEFRGACPDSALCMRRPIARVASAALEPSRRSVSPRP